MQRRFDAIRWTAERVLHIGRHDVTADEAEEALADAGNVLRRGREGRLLLYGRTDSGRLLLVVLVDDGERTARVVTARDLNRSERRRYFG